MKKTKEREREESMYEFPKREIKEYYYILQDRSLFLSYDALKITQAAAACLLLLLFYL